MTEGTLISLAGLVLAAVTFIVGRLSAQRQTGREEGSVGKDVQYIKESVNRIEGQMNVGLQQQAGRTDELSRQLVESMRVAAQALEHSKSAHKRLDEHLEREHDQTLVKPSKRGD